MVKAIIRSVIIIILVLLFLVNAAGTYYNPVAESIFDFVDPPPAIKNEEIVPVLIDTEEDQELINIVFLGFDRSEQRMKKQDIFRPDTIIVAVINPENNEVSLLSILRDSYVEIHGSDQKDKINHAYMWGYVNSLADDNAHQSGINTTIQTIQDFLGGITVDNYILIDMDGAASIIDSIGGLHYNVEAEVRSNFGEGDILVKKGYQHLDGRQLMDYVRNRAVHQGGVVGRVDRQQSIVVALFEKFLDEGKISNAAELFIDLEHLIETDLSLNIIVDLGLLASKLKPEDINRYIFTGEGRLMNEGDNNSWYLFVDENERVAITEKVFGKQ